jgi:hypothetical protein
VLPPRDPYTPTAVVFHPPDKQTLDAALVDMNLLLEQHGYVIVLYPSTLPTPFARRLHTIRSVLESDRIALLELDLPPLAVAVLARQLRQLSLSDLSPGILGSATRLLPYYLHAGALLNSVAKLDRVAVSLKSHVKSWIPGAQFGVLASPAPQLIRMGVDEVLKGPNFATHLTLANGQLQSDWVTGSLTRQWSVQGVEKVQLPAESARWWGTSKLIEFAAAIPDPVVLYQLVASVRRENCHWCGLEFLGAQCAFCSAPLAQSENQTGPPGVMNQDEAPVSSPSP